MVHSNAARKLVLVLFAHGLMPVGLAVMATDALPRRSAFRPPLEAFESSLHCLNEKVCVIGEGLNMTNWLSRATSAWRIAAASRISELPFALCLL